MCVIFFLCFCVANELFRPWPAFIGCLSINSIQFNSNNARRRTDSKWRSWHHRPPSGDVLGKQARNQLETPGGAKSFLREAQIFQTMSNTFFQGGEKTFRGAPPCLCAPTPGYGPVGKIIWKHSKPIFWWVLSFSLQNTATIKCHWN